MAIIVPVKLLSRSPGAMLGAVLLATLSIPSQAYTFITCEGGTPMDFNGGHMTFNFANNLSASEKAAITLGHDRLTAFSDSSITTVDNGDSDFFSGNGENEIYLDNTVATAACAFWYFTETCVVDEADMQYGNQDWVTTDDSQHFPYAVGRSMTGTAVHEGGHCVGMAHTNNLANMMGAEYSYVTRQGVNAYYGPGEDLSDGLIDRHGEKSSGLDIFRDVGVTVMRYTGFSGPYSLHDFGALRDATGTQLPVVGYYVGQPVYQVVADSTVQMEIMLENNGEQDVESPNVGLYLSDNDNISSLDTLLGALGTTLGRDAPLETTVNVTIGAATAPGNYFLGAYVDHDALILETTVANNAAYYPVKVVSSAPNVLTNAATDVLLTQATLNATVNPNGLSTTLYFDYGTTTDYGTTFTHGSVGSGNSPVDAGSTVSGLNCNTTYYFRARTVSTGGVTSLGANVSFTTAACSVGC